MTKHYLAQKDKVLLTDKKYDGSTWTDYTSADVGKIAKVAETGSGTGVYKLQLLEGTTSSPAWADVTSKPFDQIGAGLTVVDVTEAGGTVKKLTADTQLHFEIFTSLPEAGSTYKNTIGLVARTGTSEEKNVYVEYACVKTSGSATPEVWVWEKLGDITASISQDKDKITVNGTDVQFASYTDSTTYACGIISGTDYNAFKNKQGAIAKAETTDVPEAIVSTNTDGTVAKRKIVLVGTDVAATETGLASAKAVYEYTVKKDSSSNVDFTLGCDTGGLYAEY